MCMYFPGMQPQYFSRFSKLLEFHRLNACIEMGIPVFLTNPYIKEIPKRQNRVLLTTNIFVFESITLHRVYYNSI